MPWNEGKKAFDTSAAVEAKRLVSRDANGEVAHNDGTATNFVPGVTDYAAGSGEVVGLSLLNRGGTVEMTAAGPFAINAKVYAMPAGKIDELPVAAGDYRYIGRAMEAATADGDVVEVLPTDSEIVETVV